MQQDFIDNLGLDEETAALVRSEHQKVIESYESRIRTLTVESAVKQAVAAAGGRNLTAIRALMDESAIEGGELLTEEEQRGAKKTLTAAAMTYVAATAVSLAQLLRLILIFGGRRRRD